VSQRYWHGGLSPAVLATFTVQRRPKVAPRTRLGLCCHLRVLLRFCHREKITSRDLSGAVGTPQIYRLDDVPRSITWDEVRTEAAGRLRAGGAQGILFCANTPHKVYAQVARNIDLPILHIGDATGLAIRNSGLKKVGLIGTLYTMEDGFMADWLKEHYGIETLVPGSGPAQKELHRIIQEELGRGIFKPESKKFVLQQIDELRKRGAQGIVLGCTEFPLIIKPSDFSIPVFDTTRLHSQMAVDFILGSRDWPTYDRTNKFLSDDVASLRRITCVAIYNHRVARVR